MPGHPARAAGPNGNMTKALRAPASCNRSEGIRIRSSAGDVHDMVTDLARVGRSVAADYLYPRTIACTAAAAARSTAMPYAGLPGAKLVPITGSYHFIMQDQPAKFAAAGRFLDR